MPIFAFAQTAETDATSTRELDEIVVEASNQRTSSNISTYVPVARQKNADADAISLLSQMAIPQIEVDPIGQAVKTSSGQAVSIFIDFLPATPQDLQGMRTRDVKKVEYYLYPTDPRFQGARYVVNFVMQKYEWGGYTKVSANNFLRTSWKSAHQTLDGKYYGFDRTEYSTAQHWRLTLAVSYTIGYGKKVDHSDEVGGSGTAGSAILR